jgi:hypothetical protein
MTLAHVGWISLAALALPSAAAAQSCPGVDPMSGYPVAVAVADSSPVDHAFLQDFAHAVAYRWAVPSRRRNDYSGWARVSRRLLPPEPRWADDWSPSERHRAQLHVTVYHDRSARVGDLLLQSGDRLFDESLRSGIEQPLPGSPTLPSLPANYPRDSLVLSLSFGFIDSAYGDYGSIRFAAEQRPARLEPGSLRVDAPHGPGTPIASARHATVAYDVTTSGGIDPGSFEVLESTDTDLAEAIRDALLRARFTPAESNCRPIAQTQVQRFGL